MCSLAIYNLLTVKLGCSRCDLTQNLSTPRYGEVHSEVPTKDLWRVIEKKQLIDICKKCYNNFRKNSLRNSICMEPKVYRTFIVIDDHSIRQVIDNTAPLSRGGEVQVESFTRLNNGVTHYRHRSTLHCVSRRWVGETEGHCGSNVVGSTCWEV